MTKTYRVKYRAFLQDIDRTFPSLKEAETWLRKVGKSNLIPIIEEQNNE